jgi:hypothetical protein
VVVVVVVVATVVVVVMIVKMSGLYEKSEKTSEINRLSLSCAGRFVRLLTLPLSFRCCEECVAQQLEREESCPTQGQSCVVCPR